MAGALCAALGLGSCSNETEELNLPAVEGSRLVTLTVSLPDGGTDTRTAYAPDGSGLKVTWSEGDELTAMASSITKSTTFTLTSGAGTSTGTFTGEIPEDATDGGNIIFYYPKVTEVTFGVYILADYTQQKGKLEDLSSVDMIGITAKYENEALTVDPNSILHSSAFLHFKKGTLIRTGSTTADFKLSGFISKYRYSSEHDYNDITFSNVALDDEGRLAEDFYFAFSPDEIDKPSLTITCGEEARTYSLNREDGFDPGKMYNISNLNMFSEPEGDPLTLEAIEGTTTVTISNPLGLTIKYRVDGGKKVSANEAEIKIENAKKVQLYGDNEAYGVFESDFIWTTIKCSSDCYIYGNIMSLIDSYGYDTATTLTGDYTFMNLFNENMQIKNHDAKALTLPATTLTKGCYYGMFQCCTQLTKAPELPAETLAEYCYYSMFVNCSSLTTAPELPAKILVNNCYSNMFECSSLNSVTCLATDISADNCTTDWLNGVAVGGIFYKAAGISEDDWRAKGVPSGWIVRNK